MKQQEPLYKLLDWIDINKLDLSGLSLNSSPNAVSLLEANPDKINWNCLSLNPTAIHLLEKNPNKINWEQLSANPNAIHLLEANSDEIYWYHLSANPNAIHLLEQNQDKIYWYMLSQNPSIFEIDYKTMKKQMVDIYFEELMMVALHPTRISGWLDADFEDF